MKIISIISLFCVSIASSSGQTEVISEQQIHERLFCGSCGTSASIVALFCNQCGNKLDKLALVNRLQTRLAMAEAAGETVTMTPDEIKALAQAEAEKRIAGSLRKPLAPRSSRPQTEIDHVLGFIAPIAIGVGAMYFLTVITASVFR